jgi:hypothetical protein
VRLWADVIPRLIIHTSITRKEIVISAEILLVRKRTYNLIAKTGRVPAEYHRYLIESELFNASTIRYQ